MSEKNEKLAIRLARILYLLNMGTRIDINKLAEEFNVSVRTLQTDLNIRLGFLEDKFIERGRRFYQLDKNKLGHLLPEDINRFARFSSIQNLFPEIDKSFYKEKLIQSVHVKGFQYEDIKHHQKEFELIQDAIEKRHSIEFYYTKAGQDKGKYYRMDPYVLLNKNGIWYLIGISDDKQKTFCFNQIRAINILSITFEISPQLLADIQSNDSISHGNQISEIVIQVERQAAPYFLRRNLLPNQELIKKLDDGGLLLFCKNVSEMDVIPTIQYWVPWLHVVSPVFLQQKIEQRLNEYLKH